MMGNRSSGLRPCPFCGSPIAKDVWKKAKHGEFVFIQCQGCKAQTRTISVGEAEGGWHGEEIAVFKAYDLWNMRINDYLRMEAGDTGGR